MPCGKPSLADPGDQLRLAPEESVRRHHPWGPGVLHQGGILNRPGHDPRTGSVEPDARGAQVRASGVQDHRFARQRSGRPSEKGRQGLDLAAWPRKPFKDPGGQGIPDPCQLRRRQVKSADVPHRPPF